MFPLRRRERDSTPHWPPPLVVPPELEEGEGNEGEGGAPEVFKCPITLSIMTEPAQTPAGAALCHYRCPGFVESPNVLEGWTNNNFGYLTCMQFMRLPAHEVLQFCHPASVLRVSRIVASLLHGIHPCARRVLMTSKLACGGLPNRTS